MIDRHRLAELLKEHRTPPVPGEPETTSAAGLLELIHTVRYIGRVVEIGSHVGVSSEVFALHCRELVCVDPWRNEAVYALWQQRMCSYPHARGIRDTSPEGLVGLPRGWAGLGYIDADHRYGPMIADILALQRVVTPGGWIGGHDYTGSWPEIIQAVDTILGPPLFRFRDGSFLCRNR